MNPTFFRLALTLLLSAPLASAVDPFAALDKFSVFTSLQPNSIGADTVLGHASPALGFSKGASVQTCYWLPFAPEAAAKYVQNWNPVPHSSLGVFASGGQGGYSSLTLSPDSSPQKWLADKSRKATSAAESGDLNLSRKEAEALAQSADPAQGWRAILASREAELFATPPYEMGGKSVSPIDELRALLTDNPKIRQEMSPVFRASGLFGNKGEGAAANLFRHWEFLTAERHGVLTLGASVASPGSEGSWQLIDVDYYVSGSYNVSATLYEFWPFTVDGKAGSLVWEDDLVASSSVAESGGGMEGMAVTSLFLKEVKEAVKYMKGDAGK
ncbi:hypothetical protein SAMN05444156_0493 [Verrucomicrobium sp. GAS474]|uniref:hypothetical protein n=1 Tax=Verrucomicrobium sp. GAS474 TaxID=1882831 RepID=UPI00087A6BA8|nr:hypothetical protein [Verrucomicrobium sp. GAS474]SDT89299.1 hypothetical protein SAMN05444156_0493 [Verrucomicrobium sp. GAS474]